MRGTWQGGGTWQTSGLSGRLVLAVIVALVLIGSGALTAIIHALVAILVILASLIGLAVLGSIALLVYQTRQDRPGRPTTALPIVQVPPEPRSELSPPYKPAIGPAREIHLHLHGLTPDQIATIISQGGGRSGDDC